MTISENLATRRPKTRSEALPELVVSEYAAPDDLRRLLASLIEEDCVHSWRNFGAEGTVEALLEWENARRPTKLFFFHLVQNGTPRLVAASAVADRLTRDFPHPGFPVLGRCCILPEFRSHGFYRQILRHRLEYCRVQYGRGLNAIHIGAVNERISRVITSHGLIGWAPFLHVGDEELHVAGQIRRVGAYLLLMPDYMGRIQETLAGDDAPPCVVAMRNVLTRAASGDAHDLGTLVQRTFAEARGLGWFDTRDTRDIEQLLLFCEFVPLVGFR